MPQLSMGAFIAQVRSGKLISFPTDTVPALAALPTSAEKIYQAKNRDTSKPLILMGAHPSDLWPYIQGDASNWKDWRAITDQYWPGALTLVLPASEAVPAVMHPNTPNTLGIRVPDCAIARMILEQTGPLATTSINRSGQSALTKLKQIETEFPEVFVPQSDVWPETSEDAIASTVVEWQQTHWIIHRQGSVQFPQAQPL